MRNFIFCLVLFLFATEGISQDFNITVKVSDAQIQISDKSIFRRLEQDIKSFVTNYKWTQEKIQTNETVDLYIEIILNSDNSTNGSVSAAAIIQSRRPVFGTNYSSVIFNFRDENWEFTYTDQQRFDFNENSFTTNLTSLIGFYCYYIIGLDFDSFGQEGGTYYFNKASLIMNQAQQSNIVGWMPFERTLRTRYNLIDNILNERFRPMRTAYYIYHRKAMDQFSVNQLDARKQILKSLDEVKKVFSLAPNTVIMLMFFEAKRDELINIFKGASDIEKPKAIEILTQLDIANASKYEVINQNK